MNAKIVFYLAKIKKMGVRKLGLSSTVKDTVTAKPFIKWAGGKGQLLDTFSAFYPKEDLDKGLIDTYVEPFLGGGAVLFDVMQKFNIKKAFVFDVNEELVNTYRVIKEEPIQLMDILEEFQKDYIKKNVVSRKEMFYEIREKFNQGILENTKNRMNMAACFIFLNRTCFNGLYRVNKAGKYNVPSGDYKNPKICDRENLEKVSNILQNVEIFLGDYKNSSQYCHQKSFVYFDPPYRPLNPTSSFNSYSKAGFGDREQIDLAMFFEECSAKGASLMLSNSDPKNEDPKDEFFDKLYKKYTINRVKARRVINANAVRRGAINEILVTNYEKYII